jgi:hypothetical protein
LRLDSKQDPDIVYELTQWEFQRLFPAGSGLFKMESVPVKDEQLQRVVVEQTGEKRGEPAVPRIEVVRDGTKPSDDWRVVAPAWPLTARQQAIRGMTSLTKNVQPIDWVDAAELGPVEAVIRIGPKDAADDAMTTIEIGGKAPQGKDRLARLPGQQGVRVIADSTVERLVVTPLSLFEPKLLHGWKADDVKSVKVEKLADGSSYVLERDGTTWKMVRGEEKKDADSQKVRDWLEKPFAAEVKEALAAPITPVTRITFERESGTPLVVSFAAPADGKTDIEIAGVAFRIERADLVPDETKFM